MILFDVMLMKAVLEIRPFNVKNVSYITEIRKTQIRRCKDWPLSLVPATRMAIYYPFKCNRTKVNPRIRAPVYRQLNLSSQE